MELINRAFKIEFERTQSISLTSNFLFQILLGHQIKQEKQKNIVDPLATANYILIEFQKSAQINEFYLKSTSFQLLILECGSKIESFIEAHKNLRICQDSYPQNQLCLGYSLSQLIDTLFDMNSPFTNIIQIIDTLVSLNKKIKNDLENGVLQERLSNYFSQMTEEEIRKIGDKRIQFDIQSKQIQKAVINFIEARFFQKAKDLLHNQTKIAENIIFDFDRASSVYQQIAQVCKQISTDSGKRYAEYYKLCFYGLGAPTILRDKQFIYRGVWPLDKEGIEEVFSKLLPQAKWCDSDTKLEKIQTSDDCWIKKTKVYPFRFKEMKDFGIPICDPEELRISQFYENLTKNMKKYYRENFKSQFYQVEQDQDIKKDKFFEIYEVKNKFPSVFCMQEIIKVEQIRREAIDEVIIIIKRLNEKSKKRIVKCQEVQDQSDIMLFMTEIMGQFKSDINGGIQKYISDFLTREQLQDPSTQQKCFKLFQSIEQLTETSRECIEVLKTLNADEGQLLEIESYVRKCRAEFIKPTKKMIEEIIQMKQ